MIQWNYQAVKVVEQLMSNYITSSGDMWDLIAYKILGSEYLLPLLLEMNQKYRDVYVFEGGIEIVVPQNIEASFEADRPDWLSELDDMDEAGDEDES